MSVQKSDRPVLCLSAPNSSFPMPNYFIEFKNSSEKFLIKLAKGELCHR
jgi:hypothetical protein